MRVWEEWFVTIEPAGCTCFLTISWERGLRTPSQIKANALEEQRLSFLALQPAH